MHRVSDAVFFYEVFQVNGGRLSLVRFYGCPKTISRRFLAKTDTDSAFRGLFDRAEGKNGAIRQNEPRF